MGTVFSYYLLPTYQPTNDVRTLEAGPHLTFLRLKGLWEKHREGQFRLPAKFLWTPALRKYMEQNKQVREILRQSKLFAQALTLFPREYGLLGLFEEDFLATPVLPDGKTLVAPEAMIDERGRLRQVDPATEGKDLLLEVLTPIGHFSAGHSPRPLDSSERRSAYDTMALPSEARFAPRAPHLGSCWWTAEPQHLVPWEHIKKEFGALLILDDRAHDGVSVLCRREPLRRWAQNLGFLPDLAPSDEVELDKDTYGFLNQYLVDISPRAYIGEDGVLKRGWRYRSLLQAMYLMLFWDLTGGATLKKCQSRGCPNYFRVGAQGKSKYCSPQCASRASTRRRRGQEP
jgi:hypothetical protein